MRVRRWGCSRGCVPVARQFQAASNRVAQRAAFVEQCVGEPASTPRAVSVGCASPSPGQVGLGTPSEQGYGALMAVPIVLERASRSTALFRTRSLDSTETKSRGGVSPAANWLWTFVVAPKPPDGSS